MCNHAKFSDLLGQTITQLLVTEEEITFKTKEGNDYLMNHIQYCCENVIVQDVVGDVVDILGEPLLEAEEATSGDRPVDLPKPEYEEESQTWTFYKLRTRRGGVTIRWHGSSNGYYSESVDFQKVN